jgi:hypothetical protein
VPAGDAADAALAPARTGHLELDADGDVWSRRMADGDGTRLVLFNDDRGRRVVDVRPCALPATLTRWDPASGTVAEPFEVYGSLRVTLEPGELVCLRVGHAPGAAPGTRVPAARVLDQGWVLTADGSERPVDVHEGWERQGLAAYSGIGEYRTVFDVTDDALDWPEWELLLPGVATSAEATLNGTRVGRWGWGPFSCALGPSVLRPGRNELTVRVASTAANHYYAGTPHQGGAAEPSGLTLPPRLRPRLRACPVDGS